MNSRVISHPLGASSRAPDEPHRTLLDALKHNAEHAPGALVYQFVGHDSGDEEAMTNAELAMLVSRYAGAIRHLAPAPSKVVLVLPQGKHFVAAYFGCIAAKAIAVPAFPPKNPRQTDRLKLVLLDLDDCLVLADRETLHTDLAELRRDPDLKRVHWAVAEEAAQEHASPLTAFHAEEGAIAMLQYTSGSTGQPRGVMVSNANLVSNSELIKQCFAHHRPHRRSVIWLPPYHDMGLIGGVIQPVYAGFAALLMPTSLLVRHPYRWLKAISDFRGTSSGGPNFAFQMCVNHVRDRDLQHLDLSCWDIAFCGAEPIHHQTMVDFCRRFASAGFRPSAIYPCYGMAETTLMVSGKHALEDFQALSVSAQALVKGQVTEQPSGTPGSHTLVSCGQVHASLDVRIVDPALHNERAEREIGEIWVSGPSVTQGYWGHTEKTLQTFGQRLPVSDGRYLRTGDLGFMSGDQLFVTGRIKEVLIVRGANYYPQDLEQECLLACPDIVHFRTATFAIPGVAHEVVVMVVEVPRADIDHEGVVKRMNTRLTEKFGIRANVVVFVPRRTIKTTTSGKLQRLDLRNRYLGGNLPAYHVWDEHGESTTRARERRAFDPSSVDTILHWITDRIAAITGLDASQIHRDDRFVDLALDSVASLDMLSELDHRHGIGIAPEALYTHNTPARLAQEIFNVSTCPTPSSQEGALHAAG